MLNKEIKNQLSKCRVADLPAWDDTTYDLVIPRKTVLNTEEELQVNRNYLILFEDYIVHPYSGFTLHDNWNNGIAPTDKEMFISVAQIMGKMIRIQGVGKNDQKPWAGWIPKKSITIIRALEG